MPRNDLWDEFGPPPEISEILGHEPGDPTSEKRAIVRTYKFHERNLYATRVYYLHGGEDLDQIRNEMDQAVFRKAMVKGFSTRWGN